MPALGHGSSGCAAQDEHGSAHDVECFVVHGDVFGGQRSVNAEAGIVDEQVHRVFSSGQPFGDPSDVSAICEVGLHGLDLLAGGSPDVFGALAQTVSVPADQNDVVALTC
jgi:hypothetical protein